MTRSLIRRLNVQLAGISKEVNLVKSLALKENSKPNLAYHDDVCQDSQGFTRKESSMRTQRKSKGTLGIVVLLLTAGVLPGASALAGEPDPAKIAFFEKKVRPILVGHCYTCHSADTRPASGLRVDDR